MDDVVGILRESKSSIVDILGDSKTQIMNILSTRVTDKKNKVTSVLTSKKNHVKGVFNNIKDNVARTTTKVSKTVKDFDQKIEGTTIKTINNVVISLLDKKTKIQNFKDNTKIHIVTSKDKALTIVKTKKESIKDTLEKAYQQIGDKVNDFGEFFKILVAVGYVAAIDQKNRVADAFQRAGANIKDFDQKFENAAIKKANEAVIELLDKKAKLLNFKNGVKSKINDGKDKVVTAAKEKKNAVKESVSEVNEKATNKVQEAKDYITVVKDNAAKKINGVKDRVSTTIGNVASDVKDVDQKIQDAAIKKANEVVIELIDKKQAVINFKNGVKGKIDAGKDKVLNTIVDKKNAVKNAINDVKNKVGDKVTSVKDFINQVKESTKQKIIDGANKTVEFGNKVGESVKNTFTSSEEERYRRQQQIDSGKAELKDNINNLLGRKQTTREKIEQLKAQREYLTQLKMQQMNEELTEDQGFSRGNVISWLIMISSLLISAITFIVLKFK